MKPNLLLIYIIIFATFCCRCFGQTNRDSLVSRSISVLKSNLALSNDQVRAVWLSMKKRNNLLDSLQQNSSFKIDERGKELVKIQNQYEQQLKRILTIGQWEDYKVIESANRENVLNSMKNKKFEVKELPRNAN